MTELGIEYKSTWLWFIVLFFSMSYQTAHPGSTSSSVRFSFTAFYPIPWLRSAQKKSEGMRRKTVNEKDQGRTTWTELNASMVANCFASFTIVRFLFRGNNILGANGTLNTLSCCVNDTGGVLYESRGCVYLLPSRRCWKRSTRRWLLSFIPTIDFNVA